MFSLMDWICWNVAYYTLIYVYLLIFFNLSLWLWNLLRKLKVLPTLPRKLWRWWWRWWPPFFKKLLRGAFGFRARTVSYYNRLVTRFWPRRLEAFLWSPLELVELVERAVQPYGVLWAILDVAWSSGLESRTRLRQAAMLFGRSLLLEYKAALWRHFDYLFDLAVHFVQRPFLYRWTILRFVKHVVGWAYGFTFAFYLFLWVSYVVFFFFDFLFIFLEVFITVFVDHLIRSHPERPWASRRDKRRRHKLMNNIYWHCFCYVRFFIMDIIFTEVPSFVQLCIEILTSREFWVHWLLINVILKFLFGLLVSLVWKIVRFIRKAHRQSVKLSRVTEFWFFDVFLVWLGRKRAAAKAAADDLYKDKRAHIRKRRRMVTKGYRFETRIFGLTFYTRRFYKSNEAKGREHSLNPSLWRVVRYKVLLFVFLLRKAISFRSFYRWGKLLRKCRRMGASLRLIPLTLRPFIWLLGLYLFILCWATVWFFTLWFLVFL